MRDSVIATLSVDARRAGHGAFAHALEHSGAADPESLVEHYLAAGDTARARLHVLVAAAAAQRGLAFMRAARLYRMALDIGADCPRHDLLRHAAAALVSAGRSADAAEVYADALTRAVATQGANGSGRCTPGYVLSGTLGRLTVPGAKSAGTAAGSWGPMTVTS